ncbi:hypothetical protein [Streptomyces lancefieldiae]|uniref:Uncharacterized protein n=1 Tax=Streptomyces lancefieldiae TaxID=3075520 RepID=A0ABU3B0R9_9ACTN|nr:hypothetical protein [Streptomyces sp. DSM 40712]MDT0616046.1 hypothetical protein [Streptomyces sp. DSM 40712]
MSRSEESSSSRWGNPWSLIRGRGAVGGTGLTEPWTRVLPAAACCGGWGIRLRCKGVKQNPGGGKTAVGLLVAKGTQNEGIGRAVYLPSDTYLVTQVRQEAAKRDSATTDETRTSRGFLASQAVLVTNYQKLINGKPAFGVVGDGKEPLGLGTVVDDAHAVSAQTEDQFRLRVPAGHLAYGKLLQLIAQDLRHQSTNAWSGLKDKDPTALAPISFWAWADKRDEVRPQREERAFTFVWPLLAEVLHLCTATATSKGSGSGPCARRSTASPRSCARRRVSLTAMLADDSALVTDFGAAPALVARPAMPGSAADLGNPCRLPSGPSRRLYCSPAASHLLHQNCRGRGNCGGYRSWTARRAASTRVMAAASMGPRSLAPSNRSTRSWTMLTATAVHGSGSAMTTDMAVSG